MVVVIHNPKHMFCVGWSDIGYSFVVGEDGNVYEARGWDKVGAHTHNYNREYLTRAKKTSPPSTTSRVAVFLE
jgi:hypothetical protein